MSAAHIPVYLVGRVCSFRVAYLTSDKTWTHNPLKAELLVYQIAMDTARANRPSLVLHAGPLQRPAQYVDAVYDSVLDSCGESARSRLILSMAQDLDEPVRMPVEPQRQQDN